MKNAKKTDPNDLIQELSNKITTLTESMTVMAEQIKTLQAGMNRSADEQKVEEEQPRENTLEAAIQECMDEFDFAKVAEIMQFLHWKWYNHDETPTPNEIRDLADSLFNSACKYLQNHEYDGHGWIEAAASTGGLKAWVGEQKQVDGETEGVGFYAELQFIPEEWRAEPLE